MDGFDRLHPAVQHHIVNTLLWPRLRPLQEVAAVALCDGKDAILLAPTAGGKTEAAVFPLLSRMLSEEWRGLSVLYICPIKALLNNLHVRLQAFAGLVGRRVELWHGDVDESFRKRMRVDPPDVLLTTPESLEAILTSTKSQPQEFFRNVAAVVVDEVHAFAGDDRGWHLQAVLARIEQLAGRRVQRVGLSATVGNPDDLLAWLSPTGRESVVLNPPADVATSKFDVQLDFVGSLENAAHVIASLHRGQKRLVFCDSRARVEKLASMLRERKVATFVSHSSLGLQERRDAERAFAEGSDCVIVATSTLELGIDVGDLDRVIQIDAPSTVASFLQRLGRTGRRTGATRNCLFLATNSDALLRAAALLRLWQSGYVEPIVPPPEPLHILAQQVMALALQCRGVSRAMLAQRLELFIWQARLAPSDLDEIVDVMLAKSILFEDQGLFWFGTEGEREFGFRHFMELLAVFATEPLLTVMHGRAELGRIHPCSVTAGADRAPLALGGRAWRVVDVDWSKKQVHVVPTEGRGSVRFLGDAAPLSFAMCRAMRSVLASKESDSTWTARTRAEMERNRERLWFVDDMTTVVESHADGTATWWTFAGLVHNRTLLTHLEPFGVVGSAENLCLELDRSPVTEELESAIQQSREAAISDEALKEIAEGLKFSVCLSNALSRRVGLARMHDTAAADGVAAERVRIARES